MSKASEFEIFIVIFPGLEAVLAAEAREKGFAKATAIKGGVTLQGGWPEVWRANLELRGAARVLARIGAFKVTHLSQLDKRARSFPWGDVLRRDVPVRVEASCTRSKIYHSGAAAERIETALREDFGATVSADAEVTVMARIEDDLCTLSVDTSGEPLHKRGFKEAVAKAPMRETMAALFLRQCGFTGKEPVVDPMCGSGTFIIEAAEIAAGLKPGRARRFAFEQLVTFDEAAWRRMREAGVEITPPAYKLYGSDKDQGAVSMSRANAARAGVASWTEFQHQSVHDLKPPVSPPGLVIVNPPYGARIGDKQALSALYRALGQTMKTRFAGWRVGLVTSDPALAAATGLPFGKPEAPVLHGGLRVGLNRTGTLG